MNFSLTPEEQEILQLAERFFNTKCPISNRSVTSPFSRGLYREMGQLGLFGAAVKEDLGGMGGTSFQSVLVAEAAGRELVPGPWLEHLWAIRLLADVPDQDPRVVAPLLTGDALASLWLPTSVDEAVKTHSDHTVSGEIRALAYAGGTELWLTALPESKSVKIVALRADSPGISHLPIASWDPLWEGARVQLDHVPVALDLGVSHEQYQATVHYGSTLVTMAMYGGARRVLEDTVEYLKMRHQFGQPIGAFQALKHQAADLFIMLEHAGSLVYAAAASDHEESQKLWVPMAKVRMESTYRHIVETAIQLHGGIGFTESLPLHYFLKNAWTNRFRAGSPSFHRRRLARSLGLS